MGMLTKLVTLPLAPVRGVVWLTERLMEAAENEAYSEGAIRRQFAELEAALVSGEIDPDEYAREEEALLQRLADARAVGRGTAWGDPHSSIGEVERGDERG